MKRKQRINNLLLNKFKEFSIEIIDNSHLHIGHNNFNGKQESHFQIILKCKFFQNFNRLQIHRKINQLLEEEFKDGLHSLEIIIK